MNMKTIKSKTCLCMCCMEEHEVKTVLVDEKATFKGKTVEYDALYLYCDRAEELYMDEQQMQENDMRLKDAYRESEGLLTSAEIVAIRKQYGITQKDLCILLGWGSKTITRYESHQVQDRAHDTILKKISHDPEWFLSLLKDAKADLSPEAYQQYQDTAITLYEKNQDQYLRRAIEAKYAKFYGSKVLHGNAELSLDKVVDVIRYFAASDQIINLYKVKLMKLMWYADALSYKLRGYAITGLVYKALPMGAVPVGHESIIDLKDVPCEEIEINETNAYHFVLKSAIDFPTLSADDQQILDKVIQRFGMMKKEDLVEFMHQEKAYKKTDLWDVISFEYAAYLQI